MQRALTIPILHYYASLHCQDSSLFMSLGLSGGTGGPLLYSREDSSQQRPRVTAPTLGGSPQNFPR